MHLIKFILLFFVFGTSSVIGILMAKKYSNRLNMLKNIKEGLNIFEVKINFSCDTIPEIFAEIATKIERNSGKIFSDTILYLQNSSVQQAWEMSIDKNLDCLKQEDKVTLKSLGKLLGKTDINGQIAQLKLVNNFLEKQINNAEEEKSKNEKMYKKLGVIAGIAMVVVLI